MDLPDHADEFIASIRAERGLSPNTALAYRRDLIQYQETVDDLRMAPDEEVVRTHLERLRSRELAPTSIARKFASIRAYHRFLVTEGHAASDPTTGIQTPSRPLPLPKALTIPEITAIIEGVEGDEPVDVRDRAVIETLYATGCRVSELTGMDLHDYDTETRTVLVTGKGDKQRLIPVGGYADRAIREWLPVRLEMISERRTGAMFVSTRGNRLSRQAVWRIVKARGRRAGVDESRLTPHVFRHSAATHMVEGGADLRTVQELLGHASLTTTQIYTKVSPEHLREIVLTSHPRGGQ
ncbi:MAG: tyrosine recombinase [Acidimicrobiia bacterium]|nr:tyrosine recombinase [Acidimicrobiia bacterium]